MTPHPVKRAASVIPFLGPLEAFPPVESARKDFGGLLAIGADLGPGRLLEAYRQGIFPWGTCEGQPLWYCPDPRMVMFPEEFRLSRSLRKTLRGGQFEVRFDTRFGDVMLGCAETVRPGQDGTWISDDMRTAYTRLHELGWSHSVETYVEGDLVGGLYGVAIGHMFYGESMFSRRPNASKVAFAHLIRYLSDHQYGMIDCQMHTEHLASLGGRQVPRDLFLARLSALTAEDAPRARWTAAYPADSW